MRKAFTLIELVVAVALLAMMISFASLIFDMSIDTHRTAMASAEIMQKLQAITGQLNADFKGLRKDGVIFLVWDARYDVDLDRYVRFDTIMFFSSGDFQSYREYTGKTVAGNVARICYMLARNTDGRRAWEFTDLTLNAEGRKRREQERRGRIFGRSQHILTADDTFDNFPDLASIPLPFTDTDNEQYEAYNNWYEHDRESLVSWTNSTRGGVLKDKVREMLTVCTDVTISGGSAENGGLIIDTTNPDSIHMLFCQGVGEFKIQGWYYDSVQSQSRWFPEVDPDGDGDLDDSDFFTTGVPPVVDTSKNPAVLYPKWGFGAADDDRITYPSALLDEAHFDEIPGLGRALKFTFTLYDSKGVLEDGKTYTHIVYLGD